MDLTGKCAGADWTEQNKLFQTLSNLCNLAFSNCSKNVIQIALKWLFFSEKLQELLSGWGLRHPGPYLGNLAVSNCSKNVQNVIQMAIFRKIARIAQRLGASAPGPHL